MPRPAKPSTLDSLDRRVDSLAHEFAAALVQAVREHIAVEVSRVIRGGRETSPSSGRPGSRSYRDELLKQLLGVISASPGLHAEQIYEKIAASQKVAKAALRKLRTLKKVRIRGKKRAAVYFKA